MHISLSQLTKKTVFVTSVCLMLLSCTTTPKKNQDTKDKELAPPKLTRPEVRKIWVPDQIHDNIYETGHWQFVIDKQSVWAKPE